MATKKPLVVSSGEVEQIQSADVVDYSTLGTGGLGTGTKVLYDDNTWKIPGTGSGSTTKTTLANFGSWQRSGKFTVTDAAITGSAIISCSIGKMIYSDGLNWSEDETPSIIMNAIAGTGTFDVWWQCVNREHVGGNIRINYNYQ